jgi:outer membrane protein, heavy metal efflux system
MSCIKKRTSFFILSLTLAALMIALAPSSKAAVSETLSIDQAVAQGLKSNLDILAAKYGVPLAEADEITAGLWVNPAVLFDAVAQPFSGNWNQTNAGGPRQYDMIFSIPLDLSGKRSSATKSAHEAVGIARSSFEDALRLKVQDIRLAYIDVIAQEHQLSLAKEKEGTLKNLVTMTENRVGHSGRLPLLLMRAQLAWDQAKLDIRSREISIRAALVQLSTLLGRGPSDPAIDAQTKLKDFKFALVPDRDKLIGEALEIRPDLKSLRQTLKKTDYDQDLAHAQVWDNFNFTLGLTHQGPNDANPFDPNSNVQGGVFSWNAGITMPLPFLSHSQGTLQKALLTKGQTERQVDAKVLSIHQEISGLIEQLELGRSLIDDYETKQLKRAREVRDAQQRQFGTGNSALLDFLDAVSAYQATVSAYYDAVADYRRNLARLSASVGRDL